MKSMQVVLPGLTVWALGFVLLSTVPIRAEEPVATVTLELATRIVQGETLEGSLVLHPISRPGEPVSIPVKGGRKITADLPAHSVWEVHPEIRRYWSGRIMIRVPGAGEKTGYILGLWPKAALAGLLSVEAGERLPAKLSIRLRAARIPGREPDVPDLAVDCPVGRQGEWKCELPATLVDLSVWAEGFVPHHWWAARLERDKTLDLGRLALKKGASVSGWAQIEEGTLDTEKAVARLSPLVAPGQNSSMAERVRGSALEVPLTERGFFQFPGVAPGSYSVEVTQPGFAPARVFPVEVWAGSETALTQPLVLRRPLEIDLSLSPETDWLGKPWRVEITRSSDAGGGRTGPVFEGPADSKGRLTIPGQAPGTFRLLVFDSMSNPLYSDSEVLIRDASDARLGIEIDLITLKGEALLGDEPLAATLYFGGRHAALGSRMESDEHGKFHGVLPREGTWLVDIESREPARSTHSKVHVEARGDGTARVSIRVPDTRVFGRVVDEEGRPASAQVFAESGEGHMDVSTRADGSFEIHGLPTGPLRLSAETGSRERRLASDSTLVVLAEEQPAGPLELRLRKSKSFLGRVQSARGPIPGASLAVFPWRPLLPGGDSARTDLQGSFEVRIPEPTEAVLAIVSPPGNGLKAFEVPLDGKPAVLEVSREGGLLEIAIESSEEESRAQGLQMVVVQNGLPVPWDILLRWAQGHGERLRTPEGFRIPNLAPGEYRACFTPRTELVRQESEAMAGLIGRCASGHLEPGGNLHLDLRRP